MAQSAGGGPETVASLCRLISEEAWDKVYVQTQLFFRDRPLRVLQELRFLQLELSTCRVPQSRRRLRPTCPSGDRAEWTERLDKRRSGLISGLGSQCLYETLVQASAL